MYWAITGTRATPNASPKAAPKVAFGTLVETGWIAPGAQLVELARGFGLTEGGLWIADGASGYWIFAGLLLGFSVAVSLLGATGPLPKDGFPVYTAAGAARNVSLKYEGTCDFLRSCSRWSNRLAFG